MVDIYRHAEAKFAIGIEFITPVQRLTLTCTEQRTIGSSPRLQCKPVQLARRPLSNVAATGESLFRLFPCFVPESFCSPLADRQPACISQAALPVHAAASSSAQRLSSIASCAPPASVRCGSSFTARKPETFIFTGSGWQAILLEDLPLQLLRQGQSLHYRVRRRASIMAGSGVFIAQCRGI